ncbi:hypothetical protein A2738_01435 [Candidatus Nomurabacteria bacterium RIFCSPHIGHO2_01_FULL_42_15]|uniref:DUF2914 domain-containing protein n=1 Tax=Candidatus Nomurabacteria bacterium RIFCSPHIGHO2_01_FULL_42_15 TaxID=1801742 RepID=A0A1F6VG34_9BACT|nr:MAG: hypothetical protein A2738_01435 [Candidatus Nomurabacteria bacterium RIFCSPHIGHO2_01_FULL_42_15]OGI93049.1 MAG: hypothetical protein A3A99_00735 [Candidatus Nomurabacteria bacterium RIFCSPLOWO2_01_FULL_41_18]
MHFIGPVKDFYARFERKISSFFLLFGFIFDAFTLKRVDTIFENIIISIYLILIGVFIILIHLKENEVGGEENPSKAHFWYVNILQFAFGGIFSAYLILYFRSADIFVAWPFVALLAATFIANEFLKKHYVRLSFQISLFFLSIYSFAIFVVPVLLHKIGTLVFLLSGVLSLIAIVLFIILLFHLIKDKFVKSKKLLVALITSIFFLVNFLYFTNLIPPIPLSLKDGGIYHSIEKNAKGNYEVTYEDHGLAGYFSFYPSFSKQAGAGVYAYSAVFSPENLNISVLHEWQYYDRAQKKWITESVIRLPVVGGRDGGFRTYSVRTNVAFGRWRVNVKTEEGKIIGRLRFNVVQVDTEPVLSTMVK